MSKPTFQEKIWEKKFGKDYTQRDPLLSREIDKEYIERYDISRTSLNKKVVQVGAIIQARMGSDRLLGKVLKEIEDKPMIWHVIERLSYCKKLDDIILAIPDTKENDILEKFSQENKLKYFRGDEEDVLSRYYGAAKKFKIDVIVRITADCPLIDPVIADRVIEKHLSSKADFTANFLEGEKGTSIRRSFPRGLEVEVFNFKTLERVHQEAKKAYQREHVDPYIFEHPEIFSLATIENQEDISYFRWTVDEKEDIELARKIYRKLYEKNNIFLMQDILNLFKKYPELKGVNKDVTQKKI